MGGAKGDFVPLMRANARQVTFREPDTGWSGAMRRVTLMQMTLTAFVERSTYLKPS